MKCHHVSLFAIPNLIHTQSNSPPWIAFTFKSVFLYSTAEEPLSLQVRCSASFSSAVAWLWQKWFNISPFTTKLQMHCLYWIAKPQSTSQAEPSVHPYYNSIFVVRSSSTLSPVLDSFLLFKYKIIHSLPKKQEEKQKHTEKEKNLHT